MKSQLTVKLIGYLIVVSILPLSIFALLSYNLARDTLVSLAHGYGAQLLDSQTEYLQQQMEQVENLAGRIAGTEEISAVAAKVDAHGDQHSAYDDLATQAKIRQNLNAYSGLKGIVSIDLLTNGGHRFYVGDTLTVAPADETTRRRYYGAGLEAAQSVLWLGVEDNLNPASPKRKVISALKIINRYSEEKRTSEPVGMLLIDYSTESLAAHFRQIDLGKEAYLLVVDGHGRLVYAPEPGRIGAARPVQFDGLPQKGKGSVRLTLDGRQAYVGYSCLDQTAWCAYSVIPEQTLLAPMQRLTQAALLLMLLCFAVIAMAGRRFRRNIVLPIQAISNGFKKIQDLHAGSVEPLNLPTTRDEIAELVAWFNDFLASLHLREQYEARLRESEHKFSSIFQLSPVPLGIVRIGTGEFVDVNDHWQRQFGFTHAEVVGRTSIALDIWLDPEDRQRMLAEVEQTRAVQDFATRHKTKDGRILDIVMSGRPLQIDGADVFIFSPVDVTRQHQIEQQIRDINQQLESRVKSRTEKLELANRELAEAMNSLQQTKSELVRSEKMAALGSLVAGVAHELNTPIGNSVTVASTLQDQTETTYKAVLGPGVRRSEILEYLDSVARGTELLMRNLGTARELVAGFKQVAADQASNQRRQFNLKETVEGILATLAPMYKKTPFTMACEIDAGIVMDSYPGPLGQMLTNFVTNALTHAFEGRTAGSMRLTCTRHGEAEVELRFSDDGAGIPEEHRNRVFDPFFTTKLGRGGSGLGLNIVYNIVTSILGGTIVLESEVGKGTSFIVVLPLHAPLIASSQSGSSDPVQF